MEWGQSREDHLLTVHTSAWGACAFGITGKPTKWMVYNACWHMSNRKTERHLWYYFIYTINILISTMSVCVLWFWEAVFPNACVPWLQVTAPSVGFFLYTTLVRKITPVNGLHWSKLQLTDTLWCSASTKNVRFVYMLTIILWATLTGSETHKQCFCSESPNELKYGF